MFSFDWAAVRNGSPQTSPARCEWSVFWVPRALPTLTFIISYAKSMGHSVWMSKTCKSGSESSCMYVRTDIHDEECLVGLWFRPKQLQKWSKKCLKIGVWQFMSCANGSLKSVRWRESSVTRAYEKCNSTCKSALIATVIMYKNSSKCSLSIKVTFIVNKRVFYVQKNWRSYFTNKIYIYIWQNGKFY